MNRLTITTVCGFLLALAVSAAASYWLALNPPFQLHSPSLVESLEEMGERVFVALDGIPESAWEETLDNIDGIDDYFVEWFDAHDYEVPVEDSVMLDSGNRVLSYLVDGTPVIEILFNQERIVIELVPVQGYDKRYFLNGVATIGVVLLIGLSAAMLTLAPTARRLGRLQSLAEAYSLGNFSDKSSDGGSDAIGNLGKSMESMADQVQVLLHDNEQLVKEQQELMRAVAHEFRAPMARMRFALEMHDDAALGDANRAEISTALDELDELVTEVLRYARLQRSAPDLTMLNVSLADLVSDSVSSVQALRPEVPVAQALHSKLATLDVDPMRCQRALRNLISNALKYTNSQVAVRSDSDGDQLWIHVDDDGPGIPAEHRKRILMPFVRLDSSRARTEGGTGLGLAIAHGVAAKHGGSLQISDSPEGGARFTLRLPL